MKMLKGITLILACSAMSGMGFTQDDAEGRIRLGVKAGVNYANIYDERGEDFVADGKIGFVGGAFVMIPIGDFLGVQPEFLISQKGFQATGSLLGFNYEMVRTTTYIDIPLLFVLRPTPVFSIVAGPQFSYLINQKDEFTSSIVSYDIEQEFENDNVRKNILGFMGGIDINIDHFTIGAKAGFDFQDNQGDGTSSTPRYKNVWLQGTVGIRI